MIGAAGEGGAADDGVDTGFGLDAVLAHITDRVVLIDRTYRYVLCSRSNAAFHDRPVESFIGRKVSEFIGAARFEARSKAYIDRCLQGGHVDFDDVQIDGHGQARTFAISARPFRDARGRIVGALLTFRDVTEERGTLDALAEARRAVEEAQAARSALLANVTAGMTAPLAEAVAGIEAMDRATLGPRESRFVDTLVRSGRQMDTAMRQLRAIARIEAGQIRVAHRAFVPAALARRAVAGFLADAPTRAGDVTVDAPPAARAPRRGDPARIADVLRNLLVEAARAAPGVGLRLSVAPGSGRLRFCVCADGAAPGAADRQLGAVSEGLELVLSRELAQVLGGVILREGAAILTFEVDAPPA